MRKLIFDSTSYDCILNLRNVLSKYLLYALNSNRPVIFLCIGTDRSTGDSLGPLVGHKLNFLIRDKIHVFGNLEHPIHAKNLEETINNIYKEFENPYIIAIDACLGAVQNVGKICIEEKPLTPGAAMNKDLPKVGDLSITGIVNISGTLEFMVLQNTRLHCVMTLADVISRGIYHSVIKTLGGRKSFNKTIVGSSN